MKSVQKTAVNLLLQYLSNNPMEKLPKMLSIAEKMDSDNLYASQIKTIREVLLDENSVWHGFAEDLFRDIDLKLLKKAMECFFVNANLAGGPIKKEMEEKYDCNIPWAILMDPTSACNLSCTGCWAAQYGDKNNLSFETLDSICNTKARVGYLFLYFLRWRAPGAQKGHHTAVRSQSGLLFLCFYQRDAGGRRFLRGYVCAWVILRLLFPLRVTKTPPICGGVRVPIRRSLQRWSVCANTSSFSDIRPAITVITRKALVPLHSWMI
jgi:hypothetical protein